MNATICVGCPYYPGMEVWLGCGCWIPASRLRAVKENLGTRTVEGRRHMWILAILSDASP